MRVSLSLFALSVIGALGLFACDGQFSAPGGHPVPVDTRDASAPSDTGGTGAPGQDTWPSSGPGPADTRQPTDTSAPPAGPGPGSGVCDPDYFACTADEDLEYCDGGALRLIDCGVVCRDAGYAYTTGCGFDYAYDGDVCWCDDDGPTAPPPPPPPPPPPSTPSATCAVGWSCSGETLEYCDGVEVQRWSCDAFCRDIGYAFASECGWDPSLRDEACFCEDDACTGGVDICLGSDYLETCDGRGPVTVDCWDVCLDAGYTGVAGCGYDASYGGDSCFCENVVCARDELTCADGSCVPMDYVCDGVSDCWTGDDEWGCPATCVEGDSWCATGWELEVCDGGEAWVYDCDDFCRSEGFDYSEGCGYDSYSGYDACYCAYEACASWEFQCDDGLCLDSAYTCDGYSDCWGGEDEIGCW